MPDAQCVRGTVTACLLLNPATLLLLPHVMKPPLIIDQTVCTVKLEEMCVVLPLFPLSLKINENCLRAKNAVHA